MYFNYKYAPQPTTASKNLDWLHRAYEDENLGSLVANYSGPGNYYHGKATTALNDIYHHIDRRSNPDRFDDLIQEIKHRVEAPSEDSDQ